MEAIPSKYKRPYIGNIDTCESIRVILWFKTPTNRVSCYWQSFKVKKVGKYSEFSKEQAIEFAKDKCIELANSEFVDLLERGYTLDVVYLYPSVWNNELLG